MRYLIGMDEAGYGPNLGPLVISATVWRIDDDGDCDPDVDLYARLAKAVTSACAGRRSNGDDRVAIADSKRLYRSGSSIAELERGVLAALGTSGAAPNCWRQAWNTLAPDSLARRDELPWYVDFDRPLPLKTDAQLIDALVTRLRGAMATAKVVLMKVKSRAVFPAEFNSRTQYFGTKGAALTALTLELLSDCLAPLDEGPVSVIADKHGGRNHYAAALQSYFADAAIEIGPEGRHESQYRWRRRGGGCDVRFRTKAESHLPTALASMASKYLRELAMKAFNEFWSRQVPHLRPTAGYPLDSQRFKADIRKAQAALGIDDDTLWRAR